MEAHRKGPGSNWLRWLALGLCAPSGASLLTYLYGLAPLSTTVPVTVLPSLAGLIMVADVAARKGDTDLVHMLKVGLVGGLAGTIAYDLYRLPFHGVGYRVFVPIQIYGVWILNADSSSPLADLIGWLYHFSNGITFGIAYALCVPGRHWICAVVWGLILETIAVVTPFGYIFALRGNAVALVIAYTGHIAYGLPLGWLVYRWKETAQWFSSIPASVYRFGLVFGTVALCASIVITGNRGEFQRRLTIRGAAVSPDILRVNRGDRVTIYNTGTEAHVIDILPLQVSLTIGAKQSSDWTARVTGIYQVRVSTKARTWSSFLVVEPVYDDDQ